MDKNDALKKLLDKCTKEELIELILNHNIRKNEKNISTKNMYICTYNVIDDNREKVGVFLRKKEKNKYNTIERFIGIDTDNNGYIRCSWLKKMKEQNLPNYSFCKINSKISFDTMRMIMYDKGEIDYLKEGKATKSEVVEVLEFAKEYYSKKGKKKVKK